MQYENLIVLVGAGLIVSGIILLSKGKSPQSSSEFKLLGISIKLQNTSLALIVTGVIVFLVPYLITSKGVATVNIDAFPFKVQEGDSVLVFWYAANIEETFLITQNQRKENVDPVGQKTVQVVGDSKFTLEGMFAENRISASTRVAVNPRPKAVIEEFAFDPPVIEQGNPVILFWKTKHIDKAFLVNSELQEKQVSAVDFLKLKPLKNMTYQLRLKNGDSALASVKVKKPLLGQLMGDESPEISYFKANGMQTAPGKKIQLSWEVHNADSVRITGIGKVQSTGSRVVHPKQATNYKLIAWNTVGEQTDLIRIEMTEPSPPVISFSSYPSWGRAGDKVVLTWEVNHAKAAAIHPEIGSVPLSGSREIIVPDSSVIYTLTAESQDGVSDAELIISKIPEWLDESNVTFLKKWLDLSKASRFK